MPAPAKERLHRKKALKSVLMDKDFADVKAGETMFVATPLMFDQYVRSIPFGETRTVEQMKRDLAAAHQCDKTCPVSTAIFARMVAEVALEDPEEGRPTGELSPFWRLLSPADNVVERLSIEPAWIDCQRARENPDHHCLTDQR